MARWNENMTCKFVQEYLKHDCLFNTKDANHFNKDCREAAYLKISEEMNIPGFGSKEVYAKIRSIKSTYSQEARKIEKSFKSGAGTDDIYVPRIKWFKLLDDALTAKDVQCRNSQSNGAASEHTKATEKEEHTKATEKEEHNKATEKEKHTNATEQEDTPVPKKRTIKDLSRLVNKVQDVAQTLNSGPVEPVQSEFDIFGKFVAVQLKSLPMEVALEAQHFIQTYLYNLRMKQMGINTLDFYDSQNTEQNVSPSHTVNSPFTPQNTPYNAPPQPSPYIQPPKPSPTYILSTNSPITQPPQQSPTYILSTNSPITQPPQQSPTYIQPPTPSPTSTNKKTENGDHQQDDILAMAVATLKECGF